MSGLAEQAYAAGTLDLGGLAHDDLPFDLPDALAVESDPRARRLQHLMRERGWVSWTRLDRLAEPPDQPPTVDPVVQPIDRVRSTEGEGQ